MEHPIYLDEVDLPFTKEELFRALRLIGTDEDAREAVQGLAAHLSGSTDGAAWSISDEVFAALSLISDDVRARVEVYMLAQWEQMRRSLVHEAIRRDGLAAGSEPPSAARQAADAEVGSHRAEWERGRAALAEWVRQRQAGDPVRDDPPPWPGQHGDEV